MDISSYLGLGVNPPIIPILQNGTFLEKRVVGWNATIFYYKCTVGMICLRLWRKTTSSIVGNWHILINRSAFYIKTIGSTTLWALALRKHLRCGTSPPGRLSRATGRPGRIDPCKIDEIGNPHSKQNWTVREDPRWVWTGRHVPSTIR